ncbi:hypothetical protein CPLU01_13136 [Colletotrichum plurivorum]|uniref:Uncharacterized protein n=1 Tax=Colletotrichum plurivorum TaxID=2175906 RepID=A0A8H6JTS8_9PEZI|nr:hypothetical protein CPLU01_13136 [Colletotrichum plurivorum]
MARALADGEPAVAGQSGWWIEARAVFGGRALQRRRKDRSKWIEEASRVETQSGAARGSSSSRYLPSSASETPILVCPALSSLASEHLSSQRHHRSALPLVTVGTGSRHIFLVEETPAKFGGQRLGFAAPSKHPPLNIPATGRPQLHDTSSQPPPEPITTSIRASSRPAIVASACFSLRRHLGSAHLIHLEQSPVPRTPSSLDNYTYRAANGIPRHSTQHTAPESQHSEAKQSTAQHVTAAPVTAAPVTPNLPAFFWCAPSRFVPAGRLQRQISLSNPSNGSNPPVRSGTSALSGPRLVVQSLSRCLLQQAQHALRQLLDQSGPPHPLPPCRFNGIPAALLVFARLPSSVAPIPTTTLPLVSPSLVDAPAARHCSILVGPSGSAVTNAPRLLFTSQDPPRATQPFRVASLDDHPSSRGIPSPPTPPLLSSLPRFTPPPLPLPPSDLPDDGPAATARTPEPALSSACFSPAQSSNRFPGE